MKIFKILVLLSVAVFTVSALADVTVQTDNGYDKTYSDPAAKDAVQEDIQNDREAVQDDPSEARENAETAVASHSNGGGRR